MLSILEFIDDEGRIFRGIIFIVFVYYLTKYRKLKNIGSVLIGTLMIIDSSSPYKKVKQTVEDSFNEEDTALEYIINELI